MKIQLFRPESKRLTYDVKPFFTQWAAVKTHNSDRMLPPHLKLPLYNNATWCGNWFFKAKFPPKILVLLSGFTPKQQAENVISNPMVNFILKWETKTCWLNWINLSFYSNKFNKSWSETIFWHMEIQMDAFRLIYCFKLTIEILCSNSNRNK